MSYFRKHASYNMNHRYNHRLDDILPNNSSDQSKLNRFASFRQGNSDSTTQPLQQLSSKLPSCLEQTNKTLDKWHQMNALKKKLSNGCAMLPVNEDKIPVKSNNLLDFDTIMEKDLENQLKRMEIQPKPRINIVRNAWSLFS